MDVSLNSKEKRANSIIYNVIQTLFIQNLHYYFVTKYELPLVHLLYMKMFTCKSIKFNIL